MSSPTEEDFMFAMMWNLSAAVRRYLRTYMPSNVAIDLLQTPRGIKWAVPVALGAVPAYLFAEALATSAIDQGGPGWLHCFVLVHLPCRRACYANVRLKRSV